MPLTKEQILSINDLEIEEVFIPEWKDSVYVRSLTAFERDKLEQDLIDSKGKASIKNLENLRARLCSISICNENGELLFSPNEVKALGEKNASALSRIFSVAQRLSGLTSDDVENLTKEMEKNQ